MVKVYPLIECNDQEIQEVKDQISEHHNYTSSARAQNILENWDEYLNKFLKIMPEDYERVLNALKRAEEKRIRGR